MAPELEEVVRQVLEQGAAGSWQEKILRLTERLLQRGGGRLDRASPELPGLVADRLCDGMIDDLQAAARACVRPALSALRPTVAC
jgi:hypothetical protein